MNQITDSYNLDLKCNMSLGQSIQVKCMVWSNNDKLLVLNWNKTMALFQFGLFSIHNQALTNNHNIKLDEVPSAGCFSSDNQKIYVGFIDGSIAVYDYALNIKMKYKAHGSAINSLYEVPQTNILISTAYQKYINFWQNNKLIHSVDVNDKILATDFNNGIYGGATSAQKIFMFNLKDIAQEKINYFDSELGKGSQIISLAINHNGLYFAYGSADGRTNISQIKDDHSKLQSIMTFKSHKIIQQDKTILFPVNSLGFNKRNSQWLFTAGSEGQIIFWDFNKKNVITRLNFKNNPVCCATVSPCGNYIAYANGNDWHEGIDGENKWQNRIGVHVIKGSELNYSNKF